MQQSEELARLGRIEPEEAKALLDKGRALFIDVRPPDAYDRQRIPGAVSIPLGLRLFVWAERYAKRTGRLKRSG